MRLGWVRTLGLPIAILLLATPAARAAGGGGAAYLRLMVGARPMGMGGAFTGLADDVTAIFFNPAGISAIPHREAIAMHGALTFDRQYNYLAVTLPNHKGESSWGLSYMRLNVDGIPETRATAAGAPITNTDGTVTIFSLFDDVEDNITLSYGWKYQEKLRAGVNVRHLHAELFRQEANGFGVDFGALYQATTDVRVGVSLRDMFSGIRWNAPPHRDSIPFTITAGVAVRGWKDALYMLDLFDVEGDEFGVRLGAEKWWKDHYAIRAGLNDGDFTVGASARFQSFQFDYAFQEQTLGDINRVSFIYRW
jgi:hypothetical protein